MKKIALILAVLVLVLCLFTGCGRDSEEVPDDTNVSTTTDGEVNGDNDTTDSAGDMLEDAADATGEAMDDAAEGVEDALEPNDNGNPAGQADDTNGSGADANGSGTGEAGQNTDVGSQPEGSADTARQRRDIIRGTGTADMVTGRNAKK